MATLHHALQSMVDNFHTKMTSDNPMTAEEQTLIATAIDKLSAHVDAETTIANNTKAYIPRPLLGVKHVEEPNSSGSVDYLRSQSVFAVYDATGHSYLVRPSYDYGKTANSSMLQYLKLANTGTAVTTFGFHHVSGSTFYQTPQSEIYYHGTSAILPLASKEAPAAIEYDVLYSTQSTVSSTTDNYAGIFVKSAGASSITLPKHNVEATDQWGLRTDHSYVWDKTAVLYDNEKHCVVVIDSVSGNVIEKYRDGNVETDISINSNAAFQAFVNDGNYTVVKLIAHTLAWLKTMQVSANQLTTTGMSYAHDTFGFHGKLGNEVRMAGASFSAHYRFTHAKVLEPVTFAHANAVSAPKASDANGSQGSASQLNVVLTDFAGNTLGNFVFNAHADGAGQHAGYHGNSVMCVNPYSGIGLVNEMVKNVGGQTFYGVGRTCRAG